MPGAIVFHDRLRHWPRQTFLRKAVYSLYIETLTISGFRKFKHLSWECRPGLTVIVGENNSGKTALVDAVRAVLGNYDIDDDDFYTDTSSVGDPVSEISLSLTFTDLNPESEAQFLTALTKTSPGHYEAKLHHIAHREADSGVIQRRTTAKDPTASASFDIASKCNLIYLRPQRDPHAGLRAGRGSQVSDLLHRIATEEQRKGITQLASESNDNLTSHPAIKAAADILASNLMAISGPSYTQPTALTFAQTTFLRLAQSLEASAAGLPITQNGLGYNNLIYIAAALGNLISDEDSCYKALVIEEPEAHLHPHFQVLLLRFLQSAAEDVGRKVQVFVTTHSPILASQAATDSITVISNAPLVEELKPTVVGDQRLRAKIQQYLDATRSEFFFAKRVLLVEGDAELLLLPRLALVAGVDIAANGISVISAAGLNFDIFQPFLGEHALAVPCAILSDGDPDTAQSGPEGTGTDTSDFAASLSAQYIDDPFVNVYLSKRTFEYDLALERENGRVLISAMSRLHPRLVERFNAFQGPERDEGFAERFYDTFFGHGSASKPRFAMELAVELSKANANATFVVPSYIRDALYFLTGRDKCS